MIENMFHKFAAETEDAYVYRICSMKDKIGTWVDVAAGINKELGYDYDESAYRKKFQYFEKIFRQKKEDFADTKLQIEELREAQRELEKEKIKLRDERNAYMRIVRESARNETIKEIIERTVHSYEPVEVVPYTYVEEEKEMIIMLSDLHRGLGIDSYFNTYNKDILTDRLSRYAARIKAIKKRHDVNVRHVVLLGDIISGAIHPNLRIENNENVVEQIIMAAEAISRFMFEMVKTFGWVKVHSVSGNHSRIFQNKRERVKGENLDKLIPFYLKAKLQKWDNVVFCENYIDESIGSFELFNDENQLVYFVHGDKDNVDNVVSKLTLMTGVQPKYVLMGHLHTNELRTVYNTKVIRSGCIGGSDNFCIDHRLYNDPEQAVAVCDREGLVCLYNINLNG